MNENVKKLIDLLNNEVFSNSARLGILISLYILGKLTFSDLQKSTGLPKSSLFLHLKILEEYKLVKIKRILTLSGPRTIIEITEKGLNIVKEYANLIKDLEL